MRECATVDVGDDENKRDGTGGGTDHDDGVIYYMYIVYKIVWKNLVKMMIYIYENSFGWADESDDW